MQLLYFSSIRDRLGTTAEEIDLPAEVRSVEDLIVWLHARHEDALAGLAILAAVDGTLASPDTSVVDAKIISVFPPMTGG